MNRFVRIFLLNLHVLPGIYFRLRRMIRRPQRYSHMEKWQHLRRIAQLMVKSGNVDLQVSGLENIPQEEGFVLYGNHQGMFDIVAVVSSCPRPLGAVYKKELKNVPLLKDFFAVTNSFAMNREDVRQSLTVIQNVTAQVTQGHSYAIFPEGTRSKKGNEMNEFHPGSFRAAVKAKCPIVPMAFIDCFKPLDQKGSAPVSVQLHYLSPIPYEEYKDLKTPELAQLVQSRIAAVIAANT